MKKSGKKPRIPARLPRPKKPGHPHGKPKGEKGYDRKREREEVESELEIYEEEEKEEEGSE